MPMKQMCIRDRYLTQIHDIFLNFSDYENKTIVVEGMYGLLFNPEGIQNVPAVYRRGPGCCGNDGWGGFLLHYDGTLPDENAWIRVTGTPEIVENGSFPVSYTHLDVYKRQVQTTGNAHPGGDKGGFAICS